MERMKKQPRKQNPLITAIMDDIDKLVGKKGLFVSDIQIVLERHLTEEGKKEEIVDFREYNNYDHQEYEYEKYGIQEAGVDFKGKFYNIYKWVELMNKKGFKVVA